MNAATKNLSPEVKAVASQLAQAVPTSKLVDCTKKEAFSVLQKAFAGLKVNITAENTTIYAKNAEVCCVGMRRVCLATLLCFICVYTYKIRICMHVYILSIYLSICKHECIYISRLYICMCYIM